MIITSCKSINDYKNDVIVGEIKFSNKGFALVYDNSENVTNIVSKKIDERSLIVFQKNLKKGSTVKITNLLNGKSIIGKIGASSAYPKFYNSVLSKRISLEIELDENEPYVEIYSIGFIIPGMIANWMSRQGVIRTVTIIFITAPIVQLIIIMLTGGQILNV